MPKKPEARWLSQREASELTGLSRRYLKTLEDEGYLVPVVRDGRLVRYRLEDIARAINERGRDREADRRGYRSDTGHTEPS